MFFCFFFLLKMHFRLEKRTIVAIKSLTLKSTFCCANFELWFPRIFPDLSDSFWIKFSGDDKKKTMWPLLGRHHIQHNDTQHKTLSIRTFWMTSLSIMAFFVYWQNATQNHASIERQSTEKNVMWRVSFELITLIVVMMGVIMLNVMAPL